MDIKDSISYFMKQNRKQCSGIRRWLNLPDYLFCMLAFRCGCRDYFCGRFYEKTFARRKNYITQFRKDALAQTYNDKTLAARVDNKASFDAMFEKFLYRDWLDVDHSTMEEFQAFLDRHEEFFVKAVNTSGGNHIWKCRPAEESEPPKRLRRRMKGCILEEPIRQHPRMGSLHPGTVNTIRVNTVWSEGKPHIFAAVLRMGTKGCVDNFHAGGGMGAEIDLKTGVVFTTAVNMENERFLFHPVTGTQIVGFHIPHWDKVLELAEKLARMVPKVRIVGWDIAVTEQGCCVVEGNSRCDFLICQMPQDIGRYLELRSLLEKKGI